MNYTKSSKIIREMEDIGNAMEIDPTEDDPVTEMGIEQANIYRQPDNVPIELRLKLIRIVRQSIG